MSVSYRHIIVSFLPGHDGGFSQTITCKYGEDGADDKVAMARQYELGHHRAEECMIADLEANTKYYIFLESDSDCTEGTAAQSQVIFVTTRGNTHNPLLYNSC